MNDRAAMAAKKVRFAYDGETWVLKDLDLEIQAGKITTILGANGCGKSTLFKLMTKGVFADEGQILLGDKDIDMMKRKEFARNVAIVHQHNSAPGDITVERLVSYGRTPHILGMGSGLSGEDRDIIRWAMEMTGVERYHQVPVAKLSGGQKQRVWIAVALAQETDILFLDEPTTYLDIRYQIEVLNLIRKLNRQHGMTIVMILHDINQAIEYGDVIVGMKAGNILVQGNPHQVINSEVLYQLYGIRLKMVHAEGHALVLTV